MFLACFFPNKMFKRCCWLFAPLFFWVFFRLLCWSTELCSRWQGVTYLAKFKAKFIDILHFRFQNRRLSPRYGVTMATYSLNITCPGAGYVQTVSCVLWHWSCGHWSRLFSPWDCDTFMCCLIPRFIYQERYLFYKDSLLYLEIFFKNFVSSHSF